MNTGNKIISGIMAFILPFIAGCENVPPIKIFNDKPAVKELYAGIYLMAEAVADSLRKNFPEGLVVYLKEKNSKNDRYVSLKVSGDTLNMTVYKCPPNFSEKLQDFYLPYREHRNLFYKPGAVEILEEDYETKAELNDSNPWGIRMSEPQDYLKSWSSKATEPIIFQNGKLLQGANPKENNSSNLEDHLIRANDLLLNTLRKLTSKKRSLGN